MTISHVSQLAPTYTWGQAMSLGLTRREAERVASSRILHGVYAVTDPLPLPTLVRSVLSMAGDRAAVCGVTSLRLAGVDLPSRLARDIRCWIQVPRRQSYPGRPEVRLFRTDRVTPTTHIGGLPSVALPDCWVQLASEASLDELVELADALTRRHRPATTTAALAAALGRHDRARGAAKARTALALCVAGTDSIPETDLRLLLVRAGLPTPEVNLPVKVGRETLYLDLAYKDKRAAAEYDGAYHVGDRGQMQRDAARRRALEDLGWRIITVTAADLVTDPAGVVASIRQALR